MAMLLGALVGACTSDPISGPALDPVPVRIGQLPGDAGAPFEVTEHTRVGDTLIVTARYSGGCEEHRFAAVVGPEVAESLPPQMWGRLIHEDPGDPCDAIVEETVRFDLSAVRRDLQRPSGVGEVSVVLHLDPLDSSVLYIF